MTTQGFLLLLVIGLITVNVNGLTDSETLQFTVSGNFAGASVSIETLTNT